MMISAGLEGAILKLITLLSLLNSTLHSWSH